MIIINNKSFLRYFIVVIISVVIIIYGVLYFTLGEGNKKNTRLFKQEDIPECQKEVDTYTGEISPIVPYKGLKFREIDLYNQTDEVVKGDNLWKIAVDKYGDGGKWIEIAKKNNLVNPRIIEIGQKLLVPKNEELVIDGEICKDDLHYEDFVLDGYTFIAEEGDAFDFFVKETGNHMGDFADSDLYNWESKIVYDGVREWKAPATGRYFLIIRGEDNYGPNFIIPYGNDMLPREGYNGSKYGKYRLTIKTFRCKTGQIDFCLRN